MKRAKLLELAPRRLRCQAQREGTYANDTPTTDKQCSHSARFKVGYHYYYCLRHAEIWALHTLLEEDEEIVGDAAPVEVVINKDHPIFGDGFDEDDQPL